MKNDIKRLISISVVLSAALLLTNCKSNKSSSRQTIPPLTIECAVAYSTPVRDKIWFASSTRAQSSVTIEPRVTGYLGAVHFSGGDYIKAGERLFTIDPSQLYTTLYSAEASLESAKAQLIEAENNYNRALPLSKINAISQSTLDNYTATYAAAKSAVKSATEQLRSAKLDLSYTYINAPIGGIVSNTPANIGDLVGPNTKFTTLTTLYARDTLEVDLAIPLSRYLKYMPQGSDTKDNNLLSNITLILPDSSKYQSEGSYAYTRSDGAEGSSTIVIVAKFPNKNSLLKPNLFARVSADIGEATQRIMIPQKSVIQMQGISSVWVIKPDSTATYRRVTVGSTYGDNWVITDGLQSGEMVATTGLLKLHEGSKIKLPNPSSSSTKE